MKNIIVKYVSDDQPTFSTKFVAVIQKSDGTRESIPFDLRTYFPVTHLIGLACLCDICEPDSNPIINKLLSLNLHDQIGEPLIDRSKEDADSIIKLFEFVCSGCSKLGDRCCNSPNCSNYDLSVAAFEIMSGNLTNIQNNVFRFKDLL